MYRRQTGSLNVGLRIERIMAGLCAMYANKNTKDGGFKAEDFIPHEGQRVVTLEEAMKSWV
jgi:hypothetical protein